MRPASRRPRRRRWDRRGCRARPRPDDRGGFPRPRGARGQVTRRGATGPAHGALADGHTADDGGVSADARAAAHQRGHDLPVPHLEKLPFLVDRRRIAIVREADVRPDKNAILDRYARRDEDESLDLHIAADNDAALDLHERGDLAVVAHLASVQVHLVGVMGAYVLADLHVGRDHGLSINPMLLSGPSAANGHIGNAGRASPMFGRWVSQVFWASSRLWRPGLRPSQSSAARSSRHWSPTRSGSAAGGGVCRKARSGWRES